MFNPMFEIFLIALAVSIATNALRKKLLGPEDMAKMMESQRYRKMLLEAQKKGDKKTVQKLMKKQEYYKKIDAEVGKKNLILMFASLGIFYFVYAALAPLYGGTGVVAILPGDLTIPFVSQGNKLTFIGWFILSLLAVNMPLGKVFEVKPGVIQDAEKNAEDKKQKKKVR